MKVVCFICDGIDKSTSSLAYDGALAVVTLMTHEQSNRNHHESPSFKTERRIRSDQSTSTMGYFAFLYPNSILGDDVLLSSYSPTSE